MQDALDTLRRFNRSYTQRIGVLDDRFLGRDRPLGPTRVLWEIGPMGRGVGALRDLLGLDSGHLSRLLRGLEAEGLVVTEADPGDRRRRVARLTSQGRREWDEIERRSADLAADLLAPLSPSQQERLADALATADRLVRASTVGFAVVDPRSDDALVALTAYFDELEARFPEGFDPGDTLVADAEDFRRPTGVFVLARSDGDTLACGGVQTMGEGIGEIKRMWVSPDWRGLGIGKRMLVELEKQVAGLGHHTARLDTNSVLTEAITMYETAGYHAIERYNDNPYAKRWFEKSLG